MKALSLLFSSVAVLFRKLFERPFAVVSNVSEGTHGEGKITRLAYATHAYRFLLVYPYSSTQVAVAAHNSGIYGVCPDTPTAADDTAVQLLGATVGTLKVRVTGAVPYNTLLIGDATATGLARALPTASGTYRVIGRSVNITTAQTGDVVEFVPFGYVFVTVTS